jgi:asparagine synthase (glutamine-hydrolysing)
MCGINGIVSRENSFDLKSRILQMNTLINHRGPDDDGCFINSKIAMGMKRLSIIDVKTGKQPIFNSDKSKVIVFNGEIYNYLDLKNILVQEGMSFNTHSDTEVVLKSYEKFKYDVSKKLNGMFAFSIFDIKNNEVFISRDRFGEKPLYYTMSGNEFLWSSELKSIIDQKPELKKISKKSLHLYLSLSYIPAPFTIYENIFKLEPGSNIILNTSTLDFKINKYWDIKKINKKDQFSNYSSSKKKLNDLLFDSVEKRMISDVPLGVFLSGGADSTIIASIMAKITNQKIKTFNVSYKNKRYDESERARQISKHINSEHHEFKLNYNDLIDELDEIILNYDEPFADPSALPTYFISKKTSNYVKVALTGDGGDEIFGGYNKYLIHSYGKIYQKFIPKIVSKKILEPSLELFYNRNNDTKSFKTKIKKLLDSIGGDGLNNHLNIIQLSFKKEDLLKLYNNFPSFDTNNILKTSLNISSDFFKSDLKTARYIDFKISLEGDLLTKVDRASMLNSLECRAPLLDYKLANFSYSIPDKFLIKFGNKKRIFKDTFDYLLPKNYLNSPKSGFEVPIGDWIKNEIKNDFLETLSKENLSQHSFFNISYINLLIDQHLSTQTDHSWKLWTLYCFQKWYNSIFNV